MAEPANTLSALPQSLQTLIEFAVGLGTTAAAAWGYVKMRTAKPTEIDSGALPRAAYEQNLRLVLEAIKSQNDHIDGIHGIVDALADDIKENRGAVLSELKDRERESRETSNRLLDKLDRSFSDLANMIRQR